MASGDSVIILAHWNGEFQIVNNEVEYSSPPKKALILSVDASYSDFYNELLVAVGEHSLNTIQAIYGKFPRYKSGVYAASRPFPITEDRSYKCFVQNALKEYDQLEVYLEATYEGDQNDEYVVDEEDQDEMQDEMQGWVGPVHWGEASSSEPVVALTCGSDSDDHTYVVNDEARDEELSSTDDSEVSGWVSMATQNGGAPLNFEDYHVPRNVEQVSLEPTFRVPNIQIGQRYSDYKSLNAVVSLKNIAEHRSFQTMSKKHSYWLAKCSYPEQCSWFIQAAATASTWTIKQYQPVHSCRPDFSKVKDDKLITSELIAGIIFSKIAEDADYRVKHIQKDVCDLFRIPVSYKKAWSAKFNAIQRLYGSWEDTYNKIVPLLGAMQQTNPDTVVDLQLRPTPTQWIYEFKYVFWSFKASIDGFNYCFPVLSVDGTHLYGKYKGVLLLAVAMTTNHEIFPLAYSVVDQEDGQSWSWFMTLLMQHVVHPYRSVCVISDHHGGIDVAFKTVPQLMEQRVTRRFCLRHLRSNFMKKFNSKRLKTLMYHAASTPDVMEFQHTMQEIYTRREEAYTWLMALPLNMWALSHDEGGARYGILTTNISESFNHVMKGCRSLPIYAILKFSYERLVKLFAERHTNGLRWQQAGFKFPKKVWDEVRHMEDNRLYCQIIPHNIQVGIYRIVVEGGTGSSSQHDTIIVHLGEQRCGCGRWTMLHIPCAHVHAVCRYSKISVDNFIPPIFSIESYLNAYSGSIMPLQNENEWPNPGYEVVRPSIVQRSRAGRLVSTRFPNNMDRGSRRRRGRT